MVGNFNQIQISSEFPSRKGMLKTLIQKFRDQELYCTWQAPQDLTLTTTPLAATQGLASLEYYEKDADKQGDGEEVEGNTGDGRGETRGGERRRWRTLAMSTLSVGKEVSS